MLNHPDTYTEAGREAARARNERDEARAQHWAEHYRKNREFENEADRHAAARLFQAAYTKART
jgi:hypothetical protein